MAATGDGRLIASGEDALVAVDLSTGDLLWSREFATAQPAPCPWLAVAQSRSTVFCGDLWGGIEERSLDTGLPTGRQLDTQLGAVGPLTVSPDGDELVAIGAGSSAISRWRLDGSGAITRMIARGQVAAGGYDPSGTSILVAERAPWATIGTISSSTRCGIQRTDAARLRVPGVGDVRRLGRHRRAARVHRRDPGTRVFRRIHRGAPRGRPRFIRCRGRMVPRFRASHLHRRRHRCDHAGRCGHATAPRAGDAIRRHRRLDQCEHRWRDARRHDGEGWRLDHPPGRRRDRHGDLARAHRARAHRAGRTRRAHRGRRRPTAPVQRSRAGPDRRAPRRQGRPREPAGQRRPPHPRGREPTTIPSPSTTSRPGSGSAIRSRANHRPSPPGTFGRTVASCS